MHAFVYHLKSEALPFSAILVNIARMVRHFCRVRLFATLQTVACQAPLSVGFPRQKHGIVCHFLLQGIFLTQGSNLCLMYWQADYHCAIWETPITS